MAVELKSPDCGAEYFFLRCQDVPDTTPKCDYCGISFAAKESGLALQYLSTQGVFD